MAPSDDIDLDRQAIEQCLAGNLNGLDVLFRRHNGYVVHVVGALLDDHGLERGVAEELAQEVWLELSRNPQHLRAYETDRGVFRTFLLLRARHEVSLYCRSLHRELHTVALADYDPRDLRGDWGPVWAEWEEFLSTVSAGTRAALEAQLQSGPGQEKQSSAQKKRFERLRKKLHAYFGGS